MEKISLEGSVCFITYDPNTQKVVYAIKEVKVLENQVVEIEVTDLKTGMEAEVMAVLNQLR